MVNVGLPERVKLVASVVVPFVAPRLIVVASPPMLSVVTVVLNIFPVVCVVFIDPPLAVRFPPDVMSDEQFKEALLFVIKQ